jgi:ribosomal protein L37AE/L43A
MSMRASNCPCCGSSFLLRHVRHGQIYWLCQSCRQEVSLLTVSRTPAPATEVRVKSVA